MPKIELSDYVLDYTVGGTGDPVVFVHGGISDQRTWDAQRSGLSDRFRVISYSRRYYSPNVPLSTGAAYSMRQQVDDLAFLIQNLDIAPAHLVGNSYGGYLSLLVAMRKPEIVRSLVLCEPPVMPLFASNPPRPQEMAKLFLARPTAALALIVAFATGVRPARAAFSRGDVKTAVEAFTRLVLRPETAAKLSQERWEQIHANVVEPELLAADLVPLPDDDVRKMAIPTLLVTGENSPKILVQLTDRLEELLLKVERVEIPAASHLMHEDNPAAFNRIVMSFLDRH